MELSCWAFQVKPAFQNSNVNSNVIFWLERGGLASALGQGQLPGQKEQVSAECGVERPPPAILGYRKPGVQQNGGGSLSSR